MVGAVEARRQMEHVLEEAGREVEPPAMREPVGVERQRDPAQDVEQPQSPPGQERRQHRRPGRAIAADAVGKPAPKVGLTTFRPPYTPTTFGAFAGYHRGRHFELTRKTPIDSWAEENGAVYEPVALWRRAWYFPMCVRSTRPLTSPTA